MANNKSDFIADLLSNKKLSIQAKEKILKLSAKELEKNELEFIILKNEFNKFKSEHFGSLDKIWNELNKKKPPIKDKTPNPKHVADFMSLFNKRDGLKYLTHDFDEGTDFEINKFLIAANKVFLKKTFELDIPSSLWAIVKKFAFNSKQSEWSSISEDYKTILPVKIGWATAELRNWSNENKLHPIHNNEYEKIIKDFKRITRIKDPNLEKLIDITLENIFGDDLKNFKIEKKLLNKADFYTHVGNLKIALETIFKEIKEIEEKLGQKKISIKYEREISDSDDYLIRRIIITHHNSFPSKELKLAEKEWKEKGSMGKISKNLEGYCHWSVETLFDKKPIRVNILKDNNTPEHEHLINIPDGFSYILTFYYK